MIFIFATPSNTYTSYTQLQNLTCSPYDVITPQIAQAPKRDCRAHFSGKLMGDKFQEGHVSVAYKVDKYSEYVGAGAYPKNSKAFPKAVASTFDGIAIDKYTRVIIWEKENFQGKILLDQVGPAIINNIKYNSNPLHTGTMTKIFEVAELQQTFPQSVRHWSISDMHVWSHGSLKVVAATQYDYNQGKMYNSNYHTYNTSIAYTNDHIGYDEKEQKTMANITNMTQMRLSNDNAKVEMSYYHGKNKYIFNVEPNVFASGAFKNAHRAKLVSNNIKHSHAPKITVNTSVVLKVKKKGPSMFRGDWSTDLHELKKLDKYAEEWNKNKYSDKIYKVSNAFVLKVESGGSIFLKGEYVLVEPYLPTFEKWNWPKAAEKNAKSYSIQAFGHFTYHHSNCKELVNDAQGYRDDKQYVLTDPFYLHLSNQLSGAWNAHIEWFNDHECNKFCKSHWKRPDGIMKRNLRTNLACGHNNGIRPTEI
eukprot:847973_1